MTDCNQSSFEFGTRGKREVTARFDGGTISSDGGAVLLQQTDRRLNLLERFSRSFLDGRNQALVEHKISEMVLTCLTCPPKSLPFIIRVLQF